MPFQHLGLGQKVVFLWIRFEQTQQSGIIHRKNDAVGYQERAEPKLLAWIAGPRDFALKVQANEPAIGPGSVDVIIVENGRVLSGAEHLGIQFEQSLGLPSTLFLFDLEHQAARIVAARQKDSAARQNKR